MAGAHLSLCVAAAKALKDRVMEELIKPLARRDKLATNLPALGGRRMVAASHCCRQNSIQFGSLGAG